MTYPMAGKAVTDRRYRIFTKRTHRSARGSKFRVQSSEFPKMRNEPSSIPERLFYQTNPFRLVPLPLTHGAGLAPSKITKRTQRAKITLYGVPASAGRG